MLSSEQVEEPRGRGRGSAGPSLRRGMRGWRRRRGHRRQRSRGEGRGTEGVPACLLALSAAAPRLVRASAPGRMLPRGCVPAALLGRTGRAPAPGRHKSPAGMLGESRRVVAPAAGCAGWAPPGPRPAGPPPRAAAAARALTGIWKRSRLPALPVPLCPGAALGATPCRPRVGSEGGGAPGNARPQPRCRPGMLTARGRARKVSRGWARAVRFALAFQRMLKWRRSVAGLQQSVVWGLR